MQVLDWFDFEAASKSFTFDRKTYLKFLFAMVHRGRGLCDQAVTEFNSGRHLVAARHLHTLIGSASSLALPLIHDVGREAEAACESAQAQAFTEALDRLRSLLNELELALTRIAPSA